jgi:hypothetical protein
MSELSKTDKVALGMLTQCFKIQISLTNSVSSPCGHNLSTHCVVGKGRSQATKDAIHEFLARKDITVTDAGRISGKDDMTRLLDLVEPWAAYLSKEQPFDAARYILEMPPPTHNAEEFRRYVTQVDSLL